MLARALALVVAIAASGALANPAPLPAPSLVDRVFRNGPDALPTTSIDVIGIGAAGTIFVAGGFNSVDGVSRPHGVARLDADGRLDAAWNPALPFTTTPRLAVENEAGAVALVYSQGSQGERIVHVASPAATGVALPQSQRVSALAMDASGSVYRAAPETSTEATVRKYRADGTEDTGFELRFSGDFNNCALFFTPRFPKVYAMLASGDRLYVGGDFLAAYNSRTQPGIAGAVRVSLASGDIDAWAPMGHGAGLRDAQPEEPSKPKLTCFPQPTGVVLSMALAPGDKIYLAGTFQRQGRFGLGRFSILGAGAVDASWAPPPWTFPPNVTNMALDPAGGYLYIAGSLDYLLWNTIGGWNRRGVAALSTLDGTVAGPWDPNAGPLTGSAVTTMRALGDRLLIGGTFTAVAGQSRVHLAGLPLASAPPTTAAIRVSPRALDFGSLPHGQSRALPVTLGNIGVAPLVLDAITLASGAGETAYFSQTHDCPPSIAPGASCTVQVTWRADAAAPCCAFNTMTVMSNGSGTAQSVLLQARVAYARPTLTLSPGSWTMTVGGTRTRVGSLKNEGETALQLQGVTLRVASGPGEVTQQNDCPATLEVGASCTMTFLFRPLAEANTIAYVDIAAPPGNLPTAPYPVAQISAFGVAPGGDFDGDGVPNGVELAEGLDPAIRDNNVVASSRLFVMQQYRDFFGREGDAGGIAFWAARIDDGSHTRGRVVQAFIDSAEFQAAIAPVTRLYLAYFLRMPDYGGLQFWIGRFHAGQGIQSISDYFAASPEFISRYGHIDHGAFVDRIYSNVLGRAADPEGRAFWLGQLDSGAMTRGQVMVGFSESPEYRALSAHEVFTIMAYTAMLRRVPSAVTFADWVNYLDGGNPAGVLIDQVIAAPEYRNRFVSP